MKIYSNRLTCEEVRSLCIRNHYFTSGSSAQYEKLFYLVDEGADLETLSWLIGMYSDDVEYAEVLEDLRQIAAWPVCIDRMADDLRRCGWGETEIEIISEAVRTNPAAGTAYRII